MEASGEGVRGVKVLSRMDIAKVLLVIQKHLQVVLRKPKDFFVKRHRQKEKEKGGGDWKVI